MKKLAVGAVLFALAAMGAEDCSSTTDEKKPLDSGDETSQTDKAAEEEPAEEEPEPEKTDGEYELACAYELGEGTDDNPFADYRFTAGGTLNNTGNTNIRIRVTYKWKRLGSGAKTVRKTYRVKEGEERDVNITVPASQLDISAHQNADGDCSAKATIVGTFGTVQ